MGENRIDIDEVTFYGKRSSVIKYRYLGGPAIGALLEGVAGSHVPKNSELAKSIWEESRWVKGSSRNTSSLSLKLRDFYQTTPPKMPDIYQNHYHTEVN